MTAPATQPGVDYASIDGNKLDAAKLRAWPARFAIVRGAFFDGGQMLADPHLARDRGDLQSADIRVGSYLILHWSHVQPEDQARAFIAAYGAQRPGELPPSLDLEADSAKAIGMTHAAALEWAHRAYDVLAAYYGVVMVYTSSRVWIDVFGGLPSKMGTAPLWIKIPYAYKAKNAPHPETAGTVGVLPAPWADPSSAGAWIEQYQGDAIKVPGLSSTVDLDVLLMYREGCGDTRDRWVSAQLSRHNVTTVAELQRLYGLTADGVCGVDTLCALAR